MFHDFKIFKIFDIVGKSVIIIHGFPQELHSRECVVCTVLALFKLILRNPNMATAKYFNIIT